MPTIELTRKATFSASHRLYSKHLTEQENHNLFTKCARENGHGHNYTLEVTVKGEVKQETGGIVIDLNQLKQLIEEHIINKVDHWHLNLDVPPFNELNPTVENMAITFWQWLEPHLGNKLHKIKLWETENNIATYYGD